MSLQRRARLRISSYRRRLERLDRVQTTYRIPSLSSSIVSHPSSLIASSRESRARAHSFAPSATTRARGRRAHPCDSWRTGRDRTRPRRSVRRSRARPRRHRAATSPAARRSAKTEETRSNGARSQTATRRRSSSPGTSRRESSSTGERRASGVPRAGGAMSGGGAGGARAGEVDRDEDLGAIVEAEEDAVDRSVHPSGIVPVLQYVSCARRVRVRGRGRRRDGGVRTTDIRFGIPREFERRSRTGTRRRSTRTIEGELTNGCCNRAQEYRGDGELGL